MSAVAVAFAALLPMVNAFNCNPLQGSDLVVCNQINNLNITDQEKDALAISAFNPNRELPNHDLVYFWNTNLDVNQAPDFVKTKDRGVVKDAWLKIFSLMPSIIKNNELYCDSKGEVLSEYNYRIELPRKKASGDCKTNYRLENHNSNLEVFLNNKKIGKDKLSSYNNIKAKNLVFRSELTINSNIKVEHYKDKRRCCKRKGKKCVKHCYRCEHSSTEILKDILILTDTLNAKLYNKKPTSRLQILDKYNSITSGLLNVNDFTSFILEFKDSKYKYNKQFYELNSSFKPYDVLTVRENNFESEKTNNIQINKINDKQFEFLVSNVKDCKINLYTPFSEIENSCSLNYSTLGLTIRTDKQYYKTNETINVDIFPKNLNVSIRYGNKTESAKDSVQFKAEPYFNKIYAQFNNEKAEKTISVIRSDNILLGWKIIVLGFITYISVSVLTKPISLRKWLPVES